jgi:2-aminoethylphosphonate-pyruvate transaminase
VKLLSPGPVTLTRRVRDALLREDVCHREPEFTALMGELRARLLTVYPQAANDYTAILLSGSGTAAVEAMVSSLVPRDGHALVMSNGVYGERISAMLSAQAKTVHIARAEWTDPMNLSAAEDILKSNTNISHVVAVHLETTTGRLNDILPLSDLCRRYNVRLLLDCVSSYGGEEIDFDKWEIDACTGASYTCLHGAPGVSFVIARKSAFSKRKTGAPGVYLDLFRQYAEQNRNATPFTPAVSLYFALNEALEELVDAGGWRSRRAHYRELSHRVFEGLRLQGIEPLLDIQEPASSLLTAYRIPGACDYSSLHSHMKKAGFVIYAGQGKLAGEMFRIANMGALTLKDMEQLLRAFAEYWPTRVRSQQEIPTLNLPPQKPE